MKTNYFNKQLLLSSIFDELEKSRNEYYFRLSNCFLKVFFDKETQTFVLLFTDEIIVAPDFLSFANFDNYDFQMLVDRTIKNYGLLFV